MALDSLAKSAFEAVYDAICLQLMTDQPLKREVKTWKTGRGELGTWDDPVIGEMPCLQVSPNRGEEEWFSPDMMVGPLAITIRLSIPGTDIRLAMRLDWAIRRALYPIASAPRLAYQAKLHELGAETGLIEFGPFTPSIGQDENEDSFVAADVQLRINVREVINV